MLMAVFAAAGRLDGLFHGFDDRLLGQPLFARDRIGDLQQFRTSVNGLLCTHCLFLQLFLFFLPPAATAGTSFAFLIFRTAILASPSGMASTTASPSTPPWTPRKRLRPSI